MTTNVKTDRAYKVWAAVRPSGEIWGLDLIGRTKKQFASQFFLDMYETDYQPHGWSIVRVTIAPSPAKKGKR